MRGNADYGVHQTVANACGDILVVFNGINEADGLLCVGQLVPLQEEAIRLGADDAVSGGNCGAGRGLVFGIGHALAAEHFHPLVIAIAALTGVLNGHDGAVFHGQRHNADVDVTGFADFRIEPYAAAFYDFIQKEKPSSILVGATNLGRQLAPRVAARCRTGLTADCTVLNMKENTDLVQIRPAFGGNIMAQIVTPHTRPQFCTVRYKVFSEPKPTDVPTGEILPMEVTAAMVETGVKVLHREEKPKDVDIAEAEVIVAVGRGASGAGMLEQAKELADLLGGVVACTRPLVEGNVFDAKHQIGLSGRTVKPKLILTLGISGAVQFAAGMKGADCIVAINSDPTAPIFDVAHYCVVGDVNLIVPKLIAKIKGVS